MHVGHSCRVEVTAGPRLRDSARASRSDWHSRLCIALEELLDQVRSSAHCLLDGRRGLEGVVAASVREEMCTLSHSPEPAWATLETTPVAGSPAEHNCLGLWIPTDSDIRFAGSAQSGTLAVEALR